MPSGFGGSSLSLYLPIILPFQKLCSSLPLVPSDPDFWLAREPGRYRPQFHPLRGKEECGSERNNADITINDAVKDLTFLRLHIIVIFFYITKGKKKMAKDRFILEISPPFFLNLSLSLSLSLACSHSLFHIIVQSPFFFLIS